jgi:hypothetical protein
MGRPNDFFPREGVAGNSLRNPTLPLFLGISLECSGYKHIFIKVI